MFRIPPESILALGSGSAGASNGGLAKSSACALAERGAPIWTGYGSG
jgi:hypothetical protein